VPERVGIKQPPDGREIQELEMKHIHSMETHYNVYTAHGNSLTSSETKDTVAMTTVAHFQTYLLSFLCWQTCRYRNIIWSTFCAGQHGNHEGMGQNLAFKSGAELSGQEVADMWYMEISKYDFDHPGFSSGTGHFTQVVWAETTHIGAGRATKGSSTFVVANYVPPGNVVGRGNYERNVKRAN